ncbi:hypothetical protein PGT21_010438 [Puccinia graminis f. sp. tritici]|uniref:Uncharacterized protein n=1 Tax=Puccinia graminis f. sp. tritici TaxID=56615 RepID=A0A5B0MAB9_PUCGR|nr:hypothetical protein PGTUg99_022110 [Puccinia graminis f. sp. tritici]KAA1100622.1 hypothetical protein PGTUg99_029833 [Puccinia graminis f. sp. tritici]KAA1110099.1 hypothetical protein PGT21_010438 [Puccinia graminis f. sp. tritici]
MMCFIGLIVLMALELLCVNYSNGVITLICTSCGENSTPVPFGPCLICKDQRVPSPVYINRDCHKCQHTVENGYHALACNGCPHALCDYWIPKTTCKKCGTPPPLCD